MTSDSASQNERDAKEAMILDLFDGWMNAKPTADNLRAYLAEVEEWSVEAVMRSVRQFRGGKVEGHNMDFVPSAGKLSHNAGQWQAAINKRGEVMSELHNGLIEMDFGQGRIDMRGLTNAEQDQIIANKGLAPSGKSLAYLSLTEIREAISQKDLAQVEGGRSFSVPKLGRMVE